MAKIDIMLKLDESMKSGTYHAEAGALLDRIMKDEPRNRGLIDLRVEWLKQSNRMDGAMAELERAIGLFPWDTALQDQNGELASLSFYEKLMGEYAEQGQAAAANNDRDAALAVRDKALALVKTVADKQAELETLPPQLTIGRQFTVSSVILLRMGQLHFALGDYDLAAETLRSSLQHNLSLSINRTTARWYLGALQKQGEDDSEWYERLTGPYPDEIEEINKIAHYPSAW